MADRTLVTPGAAARHLPRALLVAVLMTLVSASAGLFTVRMVAVDASGAATGIGTDDHRWSPPTEEWTIVGGMEASAGTWQAAPEIAGNRRALLILAHMLRQRYGDGR